MVQGPVSGEVTALDAEGMVAEGKTPGQAGRPPGGQGAHDPRGPEGHRRPGGRGHRRQRHPGVLGEPGPAGGQGGCGLRVALRGPPGRRGRGRHAAGVRHRARSTTTTTWRPRSSWLPSAIPCTWWTRRCWAPTSPRSRRTMIPKLVAHPLTDKGLAGFMADWQKLQGGSLGNARRVVGSPAGPGVGRGAGDRAAGLPGRSAPLGPRTDRGGDRRARQRARCAAVGRLAWRRPPPRWPT